jgi:hypothetical protein
MLSDLSSFGMHAVKMRGFDRFLWGKGLVAHSHDMMVMVMVMHGVFLGVEFKRGIAIAI